MSDNDTARSERSADDYDHRYGYGYDDGYDDSSSGSSFYTLESIKDIVGAGAGIV